MSPVSALSSTNHHSSDGAVSPSSSPSQVASVSPPMSHVSVNRLIQPPDGNSPPDVASNHSSTVRTSLASKSQNPATALSVHDIRSPGAALVVGCFDSHAEKTAPPALGVLSRRLRYAFHTICHRSGNFPRTRRTSVRSRGNGTRRSNRARTNARTNCEGRPGPQTHRIPITQPSR